MCLCKDNNSWPIFLFPDFVFTSQTLISVSVSVVPCRVGFFPDCAMSLRRPLLWMPCWMTRWCLPRSCVTWANLWAWRWWRTCLMASSAYCSSPRRRRSHQKSVWSKWGRFFREKTEHRPFANGQSWQRLTRVAKRQADSAVILGTVVFLGETEIWHIAVRGMQYI